MYDSLPTHLFRRYIKHIIVDYPQGGQNQNFDEQIQLKYGHNVQMKVNGNHVGHPGNTTYVTLEPVQSQSQNYLPQNLPDTEYQEESSTYVPETGSYMYKNSDQQEHYTFYQDGKDVGESESNSSVIYMKGPNLPSEKLYGNVLPGGYEDNQSQQNEQVSQTTRVLIYVHYICTSVLSENFFLGYRLHNQWAVHEII